MKTLSHNCQRALQPRRDASGRTGKGNGDRSEARRQVGPSVDPLVPPCTAGLVGPLHNKNGPKRHVKAHISLGRLGFGESRAA